MQRDDHSPVFSRAAAPLRTLQIISSMNPSMGGPPEGAAQICRALRRLNVAAEIVTLDPQGATWGEECCSVRLGPSRLGTYSYCQRLVDWLGDNAQKYDAVIVHGLWQFPGLATWRALRGGDTPYFVFPHGMLDPWFKQHYPLKHLKKQLYWPAESRVLRDAQAVLFTSEEERQLARLSFSQYEVNEVVVGYGITGATGVPAQLRAAFLARFPHLLNQRVLLFLGRLHAKKGCDLLLDAFARIAPVDSSLHLVMAGPGDDSYCAALKARTESLGITSRVTWTGLLRGDMKWGAFHTADAFVLPSHQENFGIAVAEALACGLPVLISNKINIWREIDAAHAGLVSADTLAGTLELLARWQRLAPVERDRMRRNALACFANHFQIDVAAGKLLAVITKLPCRRQHTSAA
jgi:glycosyltransferase involved in cell wall biosynthesis